MKCVMCKGGELAPGKTTVKVQRGETLVIIKDVPADVCQDCGEAYLDGNVALLQNPATSSYVALPSPLQLW